MHSSVLRPPPPPCTPFAPPGMPLLGADAASPRTLRPLRRLLAAPLTAAPAGWLCPAPAAAAAGRLACRRQPAAAQSSCSHGLQHGWTCGQSGWLAQQPLMACSPASVQSLRGSPLPACASQLPGPACCRPARPWGASASGPARVPTWVPYARRSRGDSRALGHGRTYRVDAARRLPDCLPQQRLQGGVGQGATAGCAHAKQVGWRRSRPRLGCCCCCRRCQLGGLLRRVSHRGAGPAAGEAV
jgi:hypothetical protein